MHLYFLLLKEIKLKIELKSKYIHYYILYNIIQYNTISAIISNYSITQTLQ